MKQKPKSIQEMWVNYRDKAYGRKKLPPLQEQECQRAFVAGLASMLVEATVDIPNMPEAEGVKRLESLLDETQTFAQLTMERFVDRHLE